MATAPPNKWLVFALVGLGVFMATLDTSIVNVSLPAIAHHFGRPFGAAVEWIVIAYLVCVAALLLTLGRVSDIIGQKPVWMAGLTLFTVGSALCGAAQSLPALIASRAIQGVGGAGLMAISPAMLTAAFPAEQRGRAIGLNALTVALGVSLGPTLGGLITERSSWRYIFYLNVPIGMVALLATWKLLPRHKRESEQRFDPLGASLLAIALASLVALMSVGNEAGWSSPPTLALAVAGAASGLAFLVHERRHPYPVVDFMLFHNRVFASASLSLVLSFWAAFAIGILLPFYFEQLRGYGPAHTGLMLTPFPFTIAVLAPISGAVADRIGTRLLATSGMALMSGGLLLLSRLDVDSSRTEIIAYLIAAGAGQALFQAPNNSALMGAASAAHQGLASGLLATGRVVGQSLSVALSGAVFGGLGGAAAGRALVLHAHGGGATAEALQATFERGFRVSFEVLAVLAALAAVTSLVRGRETQYQRTDRVSGKPRLGRPE